jgi:hypothetical protein
MSEGGSEGGGGGVGEGGERGVIDPYPCEY